MDFPEEMTVDSWFEYWISMKKRIVRPNTVRNYTERYHRNIKPVIGKKILGSVNTSQCQTVMNRMADEGYRTSTIYQARITLYNMLDYAYQNDVIMKNPCNKMVRSDIGKPSEKKEALTLQYQCEFCNALKVTVMEWSELFQYWDHHEPLCAYNGRTKTKRNRPDCGCFESGLIFFDLKNWYIIGTWQVNG